MKIYQVISSNKVTNKREKGKKKYDGFEERNGRRRRHNHKD
jgi:hypothetical protein